MAYQDRVEQQLQEARRELEAAEQGLKAGTEAARVRYARALHEAAAVRSVRKSNLPIRIQIDPAELL